MLESIFLSLFMKEKISHRIFVFEGKRDLEKRFAGKIQNYGGIKGENYYYLILIDQDGADCKKLKEKYEKLIKEKIKREISVLIRIACHELESFYLGDLDAVENALRIKIPGKQDSKKYREPDQIEKPSDFLKKITKSEYMKSVEQSKKIGSLLKLDGSNKSKSFNALIKGIKDTVIFN